MTGATLLLTTMYSRTGDVSLFQKHLLDDDVISKGIRRERRRQLVGEIRVNDGGSGNSSK